MSGHGHRDISGLRWSLGNKQFVARLNHGTPYLFKRTKQKTETSVEPYWSVKPSPYTDPQLILSSTIGDLDWQNDTEVLTWNHYEDEHVYRYSKPIMTWVYEDGHRLYNKRKKSQACPKKIVGAAINKLIDKRYIAICAEEDDYVVTLSLWSIKNFETDAWVLEKTFDSLERGLVLFTSFFFNYSGTQAVATTQSLLLSTSITSCHRLKIDVTNNEGVLNATLTLENPYPDSTETSEGVDGITSIKTINGTSLLYSDYYHQINRTSETVDEIVDLVVTVNGTKSITQDGIQFETDEFGNPGTGVFWILVQSDTRTETITGAFKVIKNTVSGSIDLITLPFSQSYTSSYSAVAIEPTRTEGSASFIYNKIEFNNADLRVPVLFITKTEGDPYITESITQESYGTTKTITTSGDMYYRLYGVNTEILYEHHEVINKVVGPSGVTPFSTEAVGFPIYASGLSSVSLNSYESLYVWYDWDWLTGQAKALLRKRDVSVFLSYKYNELLSGGAYYSFTITCLTDGEPMTLAGIEQNEFYNLSVV